MALVASAGCPNAPDNNTPTALANAAAFSAHENCPGGGAEIELGRDANGNGQLDADEVQRLAVVCDGAKGQSVLIVTETEETSDACPQGGIRVRTGMDANEDGTLDTTEITRSERVCDGATGTTGLTSMLVLSEESDVPSCPNGGDRMRTGIDANRDGMLVDEETEQNLVFCHGAPGASFRVQVSEVSAGNITCPTGGTKVEAGLDENDDGILQNSEIDQPRPLIFATVPTATQANLESRALRVDQARAQGGARPRFRRAIRPDRGRHSDRGLARCG